MRQSKIGLHTFMAVPALVLFTLFFLLPLAQGIGMSFTDWDGLRTPNFVGLQNFFNFFKDTRALNDIKTTVLFALGSASLLNLVGLVYALIMDGKFRGKGLARVIIYLPAVISPLIMGYIWYFLLQPGRGFLSIAIKQLGHSEELTNWMNTYCLQITSVINVWQYTGMAMVIIWLAYRDTKELYELKIDGAGYGGNYGMYTSCYSSIR